MLIVIEGIDGSGKTTLAQRLSNAWGFEYRHYPFSLDPATASKNLQQAMFDDLVKHKPSAEFDWVVDRYTQSSYVYGMPSKLYQRLVTCVPTPDLTVYLDISPQESLDRCLRRGLPDPLGYDSASIVMRQDLINRYQELTWDIVLDATLSPDQLFDTLVSKIRYWRLL